MARNSPHLATARLSAALASRTTELGGVTVPVPNLLLGRVACTLTLCVHHQASGAPDTFVLNYCMEPEHYNWCLTAKEVVATWESGV